MRGVSDLQLADLVLRDDDEGRRLERLSPFFYRGNVRGAPQQYK